MAYTIDELRELSGGIGSNDVKLKSKYGISPSGKYSEGIFNGYKDVMDQLKNHVKNGNLSIKEYMDLASPILDRAKKDYDFVASQGSKAADIAKGNFGDFLKTYTSQDNRGFLTPAIPFSATEYAKLPENVLFTQEDINNGLVDVTQLPSQRVRKPVVNPEPTPPDTTQPSNGNVVNPPIDPEKPEINNPTYPGVDYEKITQLISGLMNQSQTRDQAIAEAEGKRQAEQIARLNEQQAGIRSQRMSDLTNLLNKQADQQFSLDQPNIFESMNSGGLLTSSALGEALAREKANLNKATQNTLSQQALADRDAELALMGQGLSTQQQFQTAGLQRNYSLADWQKEFDAAKALGSTNVPQVNSDPYGSALGGALAGGSLGSMFGSTGTGVGALLGSVTGFMSGKKGGGK